MRGGTGITWTGLDEFGAQLRESPWQMVMAALELAREAAEGAKADMHYPRITGNLGDHITATSGTAGPFAVKAEVINPAPLAFVFEHGTQARHYFTKKNGVKKLLGRMPAGNVFIPAMVRRRRAFNAQIKALLESHGFTVSGGDAA